MTAGPPAGTGTVVPSRLQRLQLLDQRGERGVGAASRHAADQGKWIGGSTASARTAVVSGNGQPSAKSVTTAGSSVTRSTRLATPRLRPARSSGCDA